MHKLPKGRKLLQYSMARIRRSPAQMGLSLAGPVYCYLFSNLFSDFLSQPLPSPPLPSQPLPSQK